MVCAMDKFVVFDWDGTLHNTSKLYAESVRKAYSFLVEKKLATPRDLKEEELNKYLGMTAKDMWDDFMPGLEEGVRSKAEKIVGESMVSLVYSGAAELYDKVEPMLDELKAAGFKLMILSNCKMAYLDAHKEVFGLDKWFTDYYPAESYNFIPKEEILAEAMSRYPGKYIVVGDRYLDIKAGNICKAYTIGCSYGFGSEDEFETADCVVESIDELRSKILSL